MITLNTYINEWKANTSTVSSIKKTQYFIYKLVTINHKIKIFDKDWSQFNDYKDRVYINGEHVRINDNGESIIKLEPGTYTVEIKGIDKVIDCKYMFYECNQLVSVPLFDTHNVVDMSYMFFNCDQLISVPLFNAVNVTDMRYMFFNCTDLVKVSLLNTNKVEDMSCMFSDCEHLISVTLFDTENVKVIKEMFYGCNNLSKQTKQEWSQIYNFETHNKR